MPRKSHPIWDIGLFSKDTRKDGAKTRHCAICLVCKENNVFQVSNGSVKSLIAHLDSEKHKGSWFHRKYHELMKEKKEIGNSTNINPMHNRWSSNNNCSCTTSPILKPTHLDFCVALRNQQLINQNFSSGFCTNAEQYALDTAKFFSALCIPFEYPVSEVTIGSNASPFSSTFSETNLQFKSSSHIWERQLPCWYQLTQVDNDVLALLKCFHYERSKCQCTCANTDNIAFLNIARSLFNYGVRLGYFRVSNRGKGWYEMGARPCRPNYCEALEQGIQTATDYFLKVYMGKKLARPDQNQIDEIKKSKGLKLNERLFYNVVGAENGGNICPIADQYENSHSAHSVLWKLIQIGFLEATFVQHKTDSDLFKNGKCLKCNLPTSAELISLLIGVIYEDVHGHSINWSDEAELNNKYSKGVVCFVHCKRVIRIRETGKMFNVQQSIYVGTPTEVYIGSAIFEGWLRRFIPLIEIRRTFTISTDSQLSQILLNDPTPTVIEALDQLHLNIDQIKANISPASLLKWNAPAVLAEEEAKAKFCEDMGRAKKYYHPTLPLSTCRSEFPKTYDHQGMEIKQSTDSSSNMEVDNSFSNTFKIDSQWLSDATDFAMDSISSSRTSSISSSAKHKEGELVSSFQAMERVVHQGGT